MAELTLKQMILNEIDNAQRGYSEELSAIADYSSGSALRKILRTEDKEFDKFNGLVKLVDHLFGDETKQLMEKYSQEIDPNKHTARSMLEYLSCNRLLESMKKLIDKMIGCSNKESREWAKVYSIQWEWQSNYHNLKIDEHMKKIKDVRTNVKELNVFLGIMTCYSYYFKDKHIRAYELSQELETEIESISNEYIKTVYRAKLNEVLSYIKLWVLDQPEEARKSAYTVIESNLGITYEAYSYYTIGLSYFYTSYDKAIENLNKSIYIYMSIDRELAAKDVEEYIEKLNIFWDKHTKDTFLTIENELIFKAKHKQDTSIKLEEEKGRIDEPYYYLIKGISEDNRDDLMESLIIFIERGDTFWANLSKLELLKRGENERVLNRMMRMNNA